MLCKYLNLLIFNFKKKMKKLFVLTLLLLFNSCCNQIQKIYKVKLKLLDGSWTSVYLIEADESPNFRIGCYSYDCGQTGLKYTLYCEEKRFERPGVIDYKVVK